MVIDMTEARLGYSRGMCGRRRSAIQDLLLVTQDLELFSDRPSDCRLLPPGP